MSLTAIPNQPVVFDQTVGFCALGTYAYAQLLNTDDVTEFQLLNGICTWSINVVQDNDFYNPGDNWTFGAGWSFQVGGGTSRAIKVSGAISDLSQSGVFAVGLRYQVEIDVDFIGLVDGSSGFAITDGVQTIGYVTTSGISKFWFTAQGTSIVISPSNINDTGTFDSVSAFKVATNQIVFISDQDGNVSDQFNPVDDPLLFDFVKDRLNFKLDWSNDTSGLTSGACYFLGVCDPCVNTNGQNGLINGDFEYGSVYWETITLEANAQIAYEAANNQISFQWASTTPSNDEAVIRNTATTLGSGITYSISVNFGGITMTAGVIVVTVYCGTASDSVNINVSDAYTTWSTTVVSNGTSFSVGVESLPAGIGARRIAIESITIGIPQDDLVADLATNNFNYGTHECSLLLNMNNHQDALGFVWDEGNFNPRLRLGGRVAPHTDPYVMERKFQVNSNGNASNYYFTRRKNQIMPIHNEPIFIHDFISLIFGIGHFFIEDTEFFAVEDEYPQITWNRERTLGKAEILIASKVQDIESIKTKADTKGGRSTTNLRVTSDGSYRVTSNGDRRKISS